jgi:hypothetical protein
MPEHQLFLIHANKSRPSGGWSAEDYDVRDGAADGPVIGRIYKLVGRAHRPLVVLSGPVIPGRGR